MSNRFTQYILIAMVLGIVMGTLVFNYLPDTRADIAADVNLVAMLFLRLIKMIIAPLVFATLVGGIAHMGSGAKLGRIFAKTMGWFVSASFVSLLLGLVMVNLLQPGANTRVRSWCPTPGAQYGFLVTHNESISIADYFTVRDGGNVIYRPTCHYAYHPANDAVLSLHEMFGATGKMQPKWHILDENEIEDGIDELGVLLYGHKKNAYWYGSQLSIDETRDVAPYQNATGLQVTSAVLAGMVWALENPNAGIVEADEMDYRRCLEVQMPYLGPVIGAYTDWTPLAGRPGLFPEEIDKRDPWQFKNVLVR